MPLFKRIIEKVKAALRPSAKTSGSAFGEESDMNGQENGLIGTEELSEELREEEYSTGGPDLGSEVSVDAGSAIDADLEELRSQFGELSAIESITELKNPTRYAALREMGLSVSEAYLATTPRVSAPDNRAHLTSGVPKAVRNPLGAMTRAELVEAREIFSDMDDSEIQKLYQKVTRQERKN